MTTMITELFMALRSAGASEAEASAAAGAVATYDSQLAKLDGRLVGIEARLLRLEWMLGVIMAGMVSLILKGFFL